MANDHYDFSGSIELAKVALTSIVTSCSGMLIGLFAYAGQQTALPTGARPFLIWAVALAAIALLLSILGAVVGYLSQLAMDNGGDNGPLWWPAFVCACGAIVALAASMACGGWMLLQS